MYRQLQTYVYVGLGRFSAIAFLFLALFFLGSLFYASFYTFISQGQILSSVFQSNLVRLVLTGLIFSFLASLVAWPFALATAVVLVQDAAQAWTRGTIRFFRVLSYLPSLFYGFIFCWALGPALQSRLQAAWMSLFSAENFMTELLAFAVTLVGYPLTIFTTTDSAVTVDMFYQVIKKSIVELATDGFSGFVIVLSLAFFLIPMFTLALYRTLQRNRNDQYIQATRALGATEWESLHITMIHAMRSHFIGIFLFGVGKAFVEGVSIFIVLNFFFISGNWHESFWGETLSSYLVKVLLFRHLTWYDCSFLVVLLVFIHLGINYLRRSFLAIEGEELTL